MKKVNEIFFAKGDEKGLTSSSANHLANLATEQLNALYAKLSNVSFINTEISIVGNPEKVVSSVGSKDTKDIESMINICSQYVSFISYIREAIKAKENEISSIQSMSVERYAEIQELVLPEKPEFNEPVPQKPDKATVEDVIADWDIAERNRYYRSEAFAATYGKLIHDDGPINSARDTMHSMIANPVSTFGEGRDTIISYHSPSISPDDVDAMYLSLQNIYRENEKELNSMKFLIKDSVAKLNIERESEYKLALNQYNSLQSKYHSQLEAWSSEMRDISSDCERYRQNQLMVLSKLKIRIPSALNDCFEHLNSLGK